MLSVGSTVPLMIYLPAFGCRNARICRLPPGPVRKIIGQTLVADIRLVLFAIDVRHAAATAHNVPAEPFQIPGQFRIQYTLDRYLHDDTLAIFLLPTVKHDGMNIEHFGDIFFMNAR